MLHEWRPVHLCRDRGATASLWTLSGIVLAACGGGGGGGGGFTRPIVSSPHLGPVAPLKVLDGPVEGAEIWLDEDGNGSFEFRVPGSTNVLGEIDIPVGYGDRVIRADLAGATDTQTGRELSGSWLSLGRGNGYVITPITDFITRTRMEEGGEVPRTVADILADILGASPSYSAADITNDSQYILNSNSPSANGALAHLSIALSGGADRDEVIALFMPYRNKPDRTEFDAAADLADGALKQTVMDAIASAPKSLPIIVDPVNPVGSRNRPIEIAEGSEEEFFGFEDPLGQRMAAAGMAGIYIQAATGAVDGEMVRVYLDDTPLDMATAIARGVGANTPDAPAEGYYFVATGNIANLQFRAGVDATGEGFGISFFVYDGEDISADSASITIDILPTLSYVPEPVTRLSSTVEGWQRIGQFIIAEADYGYGFDDFEVTDFRFLDTGIAPMADGIFPTSVGSFRLRKHEQGNRFILETDAENLAPSTRVLDMARVVDGDYESNSIDGIAFSVIDNILIHENHPLHKPVHDFGPDTGGTWSLATGSPDNALFRIGEDDGRLWWRAAPDYESPDDSGGDNIYDIAAVFTPDDEQAEAVGHTVSVEVQDIAGEITPRQLPTGMTFTLGVHGSEEFRRENIREEDMPADFVQHLLWGYAWKMPAVGPLVLTWSLILEDRLEGFGQDYSYFERDPENENEVSRISTLQDVEHARAQVDNAFDAYEQVTNIEFIEVGHTAQATGHIHFSFVNDPDTPIEGQAQQPHYGSEVSINFRDDPLDSNDPLYSDEREWIIIHEMGHVLGLAHPFIESLGWPEREMEYRETDRSVMSYSPMHQSRGINSLRAEDIAALEFLYGRKGTDFEGIEAVLARASRPVDVAVGEAAFIGGGDDIAAFDSGGFA